MGIKRITPINIHETSTGKKIIDYLQDHNWRQFSEIKEDTKSPSSTLCVYLKKLVNAGRVEIDKKGKGGAGTYYRLPPIKEILDYEHRIFEQTIALPNHWDGPIGTIDMDQSLYDAASKREWTRIENELILNVKKIKLNWMRSAMRRYYRIVNSICSPINNPDRDVLISYFLGYLERWRRFNNLQKNKTFNTINKKIMSLGDFNEINQQIARIEKDQMRLNELQDSNGKNVVHMIARIQGSKKFTYIQALNYAIKRKELRLTDVEKKETKNTLEMIERIEKYVENYWTERNNFTKTSRRKEISILLPRMPPIIVLDSSLLKN